MVSLQDRPKDGTINHIYFLHALPINQQTNVKKIIYNYLAKIHLKLDTKRLRVLRKATLKADGMNLINTMPYSLGDQAMKTLQDTPNNM